MQHIIVLRWWWFSNRRIFASKTQI